MRVLLLNTTPTPKVFKTFNLSGSYVGSGWVEEVIEFLQRTQEVSFGCFWTVDDIKEVKNGNVHYYVIPAASADLNGINDNTRKYLQWIFERSKPDVVHIFGTEHEWTKEALKIVDPRRTVVHITGLVSMCALHYYGGLRDKEIRVATLRDLLKGGIRTGRKNFEKNSITERESLLLAKQVMGRTSWDRACILQVNGNLKYYACNEMLRKVFYEQHWKLETCEKHRLFVSTGNYPLKGVHNAIKATAIIKMRYPDVKLVVAGNDITRNDTIKDKLSRTSYGKYIRKLIRKYGLEKNVYFIGPQNVDQMVEQYLKANVYVLPSAIENSPNSLGEAMLLGVPCVAAFVGGVQDLLTDRQEGFLYPFDEPYMLAYYVMRYFENSEEAIRMGENARKRAQVTHSREDICHRLLEIYQDIISNNP